jgi:hypothetical protein
MALMEMGVDPQDLVAASQAGGAKIAADVMAFRRSGKFQVKEAKTAEQRALRDRMKQMVSEMLPRV